MIDLPDDPAPRIVNPRLLSYAIKLRPASGAAAQIVDRPGSRWRFEASYGPMTADRSAAFKSALIAAQRQGLRMKVPLSGRDQGNPGAPVVDGANPSGTSLPLRGLNPGYVAKAGYWLTLIDAGGAYYLHLVTGTAVAGSDGKATLAIEPPIRAPFVDGSSVLLARPKVEGFLADDTSWQLGLGGISDGIAFAIEEAA